MMERHTIFQIPRQNQNPSGTAKYERHYPPPPGGMGVSSKLDIP